MMNYIFGGMILLSLLCGIITGRIDAVSAAVFTGTQDAISLFIMLLGVIAFWNGMMQIADKAGVTALFSKLFSPMIRFFFPQLDLKGPAARAISMNLSANLLGLGNAATPLGITAMRELDKLSGTPGVASNEMVTFVVINTAALQLIPTTIGALRAKHGSASPFDVMAPIWVASVFALAVGIAVAKVLEHRQRLNS